MLLVDTNVLADVLEDDPEWADWSIGQLRAQSQIHRLAINPIIYSELSLTFSTVEALDRTVDDLGLTMMEIPKPALFLAGKAFVRYRRQGGQKQNVRADFFIGAHAAVSRYPLLTRDTRRYSSYFADVELIAPDQASGKALNSKTRIKARQGDLV
jgi:predicted nucleic acid-binding protein